jgi:putative two-component system response regulator
MDIFLPVKASILVVDDEITNLSLVAGLLREHYQVKVAKDAERAMALAQREQPDLILLDVMMPLVDGYGLCRMLKADALTATIPVIFLTSQTDAENEELGLSLGAVDYITRPIRPGILLSRVRAHLSESQAARAMRVNNEYLEFEVNKRAKQLTAMQDVTILAMASLSETRDTDTGNHLRRTQNYVRLLARYMQSKPGYSDYLNDEVVDVLYRCAPLHDIGKVGIPDRILLKPGRYTQEEYELMKRHPSLGRDALESAQRVAGSSAIQLGGPADFFEIAKELVQSHHEKWDGSGYPQGLKGQQIPIAARLMAIADVYDALISPRVYKPAMLHSKAAAIIVEGRGSFFAPELVDAFLALQNEFQNIARHYADTEADLAEKLDFAISAIGPEMG